MNTFITYFFLLALLPVYAQSPTQKKLDSLEQVLLTVNKNDTKKIVSIGEYLIANTESDEKKFYLLGIIISSYATNNDKKKSIEYLFRAKKIAEDIGDVELTTKVYATLASLYASLKLNDKAMLYLKEAWQQTEKLPAGNEKSNIRAFLYNEQGNFYYNNEQYKQANTNYRQSIAEFKKALPSGGGANTPFYYKSLLHNYGKSFLQLNEPDSSTAYLNKALTLKDTLYPNLKYHIYISLSEAYAHAGHYQRSIDTLQVVLNDKGFDIPELQSAAYLNLSRNYKALGDITNYALYNEKYLALSPYVKNEDLAAISTVFNAEQGEAIASASASKQDSYLLMLCLLLVVGAGSVTVYVIYRKKKKEKAIYTSIIKNLESKLTLPIAEVITEEEEGETPQVSIPLPVEQEILSKLRQFENSVKFTNPKLTIATLAVQFKTNTTYLSEIINREKGKNFNAYINELRINYICNKIYTNPEYLNYKISYLAESCGFNSHSAFATVFKNVTGISPSAFLKQALKNNANTLVEFN
ncbi:helix-turn-helix domain-containing protein [Flavobacterium subsaxonicum]|uniref:HTH araC/xylS-type domain-containing protein n=1 Tax=Flavobacterium subsaxonicum WB 4.1-42 = DSM 21790 TaxID=1121898 RepID=A0A0A2MIV9_9FLAO|nr:helix-turn-helix domain-containing protein [Flavobacterium subsaxonicum]KGO91428.1 hypothetical protein Q766_17760 [Flavobacterium subsaxonicum WB 4.1-42 = DSM 21790]